MTSGYRNGADLERAVKHHLEDNGYPLVIKSGGSKGKVDVIGLKRGETVIVQCKRSGTAVRPADRAALRGLALAIGAVPLLASWVKEGNAARTIGYTDLSRPGGYGLPWTPDHALTDARADAIADGARTG